VVVVGQEFWVRVRVCVGLEEGVGIGKGIGLGMGRDGLTNNGK